MLREDYLMRQISQLVEALQQALDLVKRRRFQTALSTIEEELERTLGLRLESLTKLSGQGLLTLVTAGEATPAARTKGVAAAALLREAGAVHAAQDRPDESYVCFLRALELMLAVADQGDNDLALPAYAPSIEALAADLRAYVLPVETTKGLLAHYERSGDYAAAEDILFEALEARPAHDALLGAGVALYHRLLRQSDAQLIAGNLPRSEVEAGLAELEGKDG